VTFTATVTAPGQSPTGNVKFMDGGATLKTVMLSGGTASFTTTTPLAVASHTITAVYVGNANFAASTSPAVTQVVNPAPTATALMSSPNPSTAGQSVALTATVTSAFATPNGSVTFKDGTATLGSKNLSASGTTTLNVPLAHGSHSLTAVYAGNGNFTGSTSVPVTQVVN